MTRININILRISELKWTEMSKFNSDDHYIYYCVKESHRRNVVAPIINKRALDSILGCNLKNDRMICLFPRQTIQHHSNSSLCPNHQRSWSWSVLWRPTRPLRANTKKRCPIHHRWLECKSRKSSDNWRNRQVWPWGTKWSSAKSNRILMKECTGHSKYPCSTTQKITLHMETTKWSIQKSHWLDSL